MGRSRSGADRRRRFEALRQEVYDHMVLRDVTTRALKARGQKSWVWDATVLPTSSHYVPVFLRLLEEEEREGRIHPDTHVLVETTTGNAGAAAGYVARALGYPIIVFMPEDMPPARIADVQSQLPEDGYSELRLTAGGRYVRGVVAALRGFLSDHKGRYRGRQVCVVNHSRRAASAAAIEECAMRLLGRPGGGGMVDTAIVALGNGTTATGIARAVRRIDRHARVVGVEPIEAPWFYVQKFGASRFRQLYSADPGPRPHRLLGTGGWGVRFPNLDLGLVDDIVLVTEDEWRGQSARLRGRGFDVGHTSAACQSVVERLAMLRSGRRETYFSMFYDPISKYGTSASDH